MNFKNLYLTTTLPEIPKIINDNNAEIQRYLDVIYDESQGVIIVPINTPGKVKAATAEFVTAVIDNLIVKKQYTNLYENITTANYDYWSTYTNIAAYRRDACTYGIDTSVWDRPFEPVGYKVIDVQKPYYKITPNTVIGDHTILKTDLKSQVVTLILDPSGETTGTYSILMDPSNMVHLDILIDASLSSDQQTKWVSLFCLDYDASLGPTWEIYEFGDANPGTGGSGGSGGVTATWVNGQIAGAISPFVTNLNNVASITYVNASLNAYATNSSVNTALGKFIRSASLGTSLYWNGAYFDVSSIASGIYNTTLDPALKMPAAVGGIPADTSVAFLSGKSFIELFDMLLFPTANPTLTAPTAAFTVSPTTLLYEVSSNQTLTFTTTFNRGSISPQYSATSPYRSGLPNYYNFTGIGLIDVASSSIPYVHAPINVSIGYSTNSWSVVVSHDIGVQPYDNKGNVYSTPLAAGNISASPTIAIEGVYPIFATTIDISTLTKQTLVSMSASPVSLDSSLIGEIGGYKQTFEISTIHTALTAIQTFNTVGNIWEYELGTAPLSLTRWDTSTLTKSIQGYSVPYTRYTYNGPIRDSVAIKLIF
jgi:hypothetical protein